MPVFPTARPPTSATQRIQSRGRSPRTIGWSGETAYAAQYAAAYVSHSPVGCTVLGAPRLRDCRATLDAAVRADRFCPCFPRCADLASTTQRIISRGHSPRTICGRERIAPAALYTAAFDSRPTVRGGVLDAPRLRYCRAALDASVRPDQLLPRHPRCVRLTSTAQRMQIPRAQPAHHFYGRTHVSRSPTPRGRGSPPLRRIARVDLQRY